MRTTIDLPDELFRAVKAKAALNGLVGFQCGRSNGTESTGGRNETIQPPGRTPDGVLRTARRFPGSNRRRSRTVFDRHGSQEGRRRSFGEIGATNQTRRGKSWSDSAGASRPARGA